MVLTRDLGQDVCRYLRPIRWLAAILCTSRTVGTTEGLHHSGALFKV